MELTELDPPPRPTSDTLVPWLAKELGLALLQSVILACLLQLVLVSFGTSAHLIGTWAVAAVALLAIRLHRTAMPPSSRKLAASRSRSHDIDARNELAAVSIVAGRSPHRAADDWFDPLPPTLERRFARLYRHVDRLSYAVVAPRHYDAGVRPVLAELARDRVRRHHGIDLADEPARARAVLGEDLWRALTEPLDAPPTTGDIERWLARLEGLDETRHVSHPGPA